MGYYENRFIKYESGEENMEENLEYMLGSLDNYTNQAINKLVKNLVSSGVATEKESEQNEKVYIGDRLSKRQGLQYCLSISNLAVKSIEEWEFEKNYKYSLFLTQKSFDGENFGNLIEDGKIILYDALEESEPLHAIVDVPTLRSYENDLYLKFLLKLKATDVDGRQNKCRYPIIAIIYPESNIIELRFEAMGSVYGREKFRYVYETIAWLRNNLKTIIEPMDLREVADFIKEYGEENGVVLAAQDMRMANGGKATVDVGNDDTNVLPFIGELKVLLEEYKDEFDKSPLIKSALEEFIYDKENLSEFPWVRFRFEERGIEVKITFDYGKEKISLLQHYHSQLIRNIGKERMDYVTAYLSEVRNNIEELSNCDEGTN